MIDRIAAALAEISDARGVSPTYGLELATMLDRRAKDSIQLAKELLERAHHELVNAGRAEDAEECRRAVMALDVVIGGAS